MASETSHLLALNRGILSALGAARVDLKRTSLAAETMVNWVPRVLGAMSLRPGLEYIGATYGNAVARNIPFVYSASSTALIELTDSLMRVRVDDALVSRAAVSTAVSNGTFNTDLTGWTDSDEAGAASTWVTGGYLSLVGTGANYAIRDQLVSVAVNDRGVEHALRIVVERGPVILRVGPTSGSDDYLSERTLRTGTHSMAFTPTTDFYIRLSNARKAAARVDSIAVEGSGDLTLPTPWAAADLSDIRFTQSADVVFVACDGYQPMRLERWGATSWSVVNYEPEDGPFRVVNTTDITVAPSALTGDITLTASKPLFKETQVGALFKVTSTGQIATVSVTGADQFTDPIYVNGTGDSRRIGISIAGTWTATVTLQYSVGEAGSWIDRNSYTSNTTISYDDDLDGQLIYYRLGVKAGDFTSGPVSVVLSCQSGSAVGIARITGYTNNKVVTASTIDEFGGTDGTSDWAEGAWSDRRGWPSAVAIYEGRLWWFGRSYVWASESDAYEDFDEETEGDAGPIARTIGEGPVDDITWALPLNRLMVGTSTAEMSIRSTSFDEPITPTNFAIRATSTQGSAGVQPARIDATGVFAQRSGQRVFLLGFDSAASDYSTEDATQLVPDLLDAGIVQIGVQRQPDTRVHCVLDDGTVGLLVFERTENVLAWCMVETDGEVEDVAVLPGTGEDQVYYIVKRTINGSTVRYVEKWAKISECVGGTLNKQADAFYEWSGVSSTTITGLSHLEGESVVAWGDGVDLGTHTVSSGQIVVGTAVESAIVGLPYTARFKSMKLGASPALEVPLNQRKRIDHLGLVLAHTHKNGLEYGTDADNLDPLPNVEDGAATDADYVWGAYDKDFIEFDGEWTTDARVYLKATAPRPCTVLALQVTLATSPR